MRWLKARLSQIAWVTEHWDDLEADFLTFYRVSDPRSLPSRKFFALAFRAGAYEGVLAARMAAAQQGKTKTQGTGPTVQTQGKLSPDARSSAEMATVATTNQSYIHEAIAKAGSS